MPLSPDQIKQRQTVRDNKVPEFRKIEALESIADNMLDIKMELMSLNRWAAAIAQKGNKTF